MDPQAPSTSAATEPAAGSAARIGPISAVVCNYNGENYLPTCLDALLALGDTLDEVLVVDNGSTDRSREVLARDYPGVTVLALAKNGGPGTARNAGMRAAKNRWVLAVDNDAELEPDCLDKLRAALENDPTAILAQPRSLVAHEPDRVHYDGAHFHYVGLLSLRNFFRPLAEAEGRGVVPADGFISICGLLDRDVVLGLGGYDEEFFILFEDYDLSLRLRIAGQRLLSVEDALCLHRGGTPGISFRMSDYPARRAYFHSRNRWLLLAKNHSLGTLLLSLPGLLLYEVVWTAFAAARGHLWGHLRGKAAFLRRLPGALRQRRRIQGSRRVRDRDLLVGGPLTLSPQLVARPAARRVASWLSALLAAWWRVVRPLVP